MQSEEWLSYVEVKTGVGGRFGRLERTQKWEFRRVLMKESGEERDLQEGTYGGYWCERVLLPTVVAWCH